MKQYKIAVLISILAISSNIRAQLNKFMVQSYFIEGYFTNNRPAPWRSDTISVQQDFFQDFKDINFNNILFANVSFWLNGEKRNYEQYFKMAKNAGLSTIIMNDSLYSDYSFNEDAGLFFLNKLNTDDYDNIGFIFTDEPFTAESCEFIFPTKCNGNMMEEIPDYSELVKQYNPNLLRYANLFASPHGSDHFYREKYLQKYINLVNPNLLAVDIYPGFDTNTFNGFFLTLYDFAIKSVENSIPFIYILTSFKHGTDFSRTGVHENYVDSAKNIAEFNYLIYAALAYGAKGLSYWPGFQWVTNKGLNNNYEKYDFALKYETGVKDSLSSLHKKLIDHSDELLSLNFASAYHKSFKSTIGIQHNNDSTEVIQDICSWDNIINDRYAREIFEYTYYEGDDYVFDAYTGEVPEEIAITFMTNKSGKVYFWVFNKSLAKEQYLGLNVVYDSEFNDNFRDVLNDKIIYNYEYELPSFVLKPGEAKLLTYATVSNDLLNYQITNKEYNGIPTTYLPLDTLFTRDEDHLYPFESANQITLSSNVSFLPNSTKSFMANQILIEPGVVIHQGSTVLLTSYKDCNDTTSLSSPGSTPKHKDIETTATETLTAPVLYPNPTRDVFKVRTTLSKEEEIEIRVYDNVGRLVKVEKTINNETTISLHNKPAGIYFVHFTLRNKTYNFKVVKI